jgi:hypothetical protein
LDNHLNAMRVLQCALQDPVLREVYDDSMRDVLELLEYVDDDGLKEQIKRAFG